jgi:hypothetical protein
MKNILFLIAIAILISTPIYSNPQEFILLPSCSYSSSLVYFQSEWKGTYFTPFNINLFLPQSLEASINIVAYSWLFSATNGVFTKGHL